MKILALYLKIHLTQKPEWFDEFLLKYFERVDLHITLIQPRYVNEEQVDGLQLKVGEVIKRVNAEEIDKKLVFDNLVINRESDGKYIFMLNAKENNFLTNFQKELRKAFQDFNAYLDDSTKEYEIDFKPHITIAMNLDDHTMEEAKKYFISDYRCEGLIEELVLPVVKDQSLEERKNVNNQRIFKL